MAESGTEVQRQEGRIKSALRRSFDEGMVASRDPANAILPELALRITTIYSQWYTRTCIECKDKFREGDRVRLCPDCGQAYHDDDQYRLLCWQRHFSNGNVCKKRQRDPFLQVETSGCLYSWNGHSLQTDTQPISEPTSSAHSPLIYDQFLIGVNQIWKPFGGETIQKLEEGSVIIGHKCPWCRYHFRAGDRVVKCPCGKCDTYFHDDLYRHLTCWNAWNGTQGNYFCPTTGALIEHARGEQA